MMRAYLQLTKPTIIILVAITGLTTMMGEGSLFRQPVQMLCVLIAVILAAASANAFNQFIDRDIDAVMDRTRNKRPLPLSQLNPLKAFLFAMVLGVGSTLYLWFWVNWQSAVISLATILFYVFVYTLFLKRRHHYNIVIGGAAGATAPLIASAAASPTGTPSALAWVLFLIIFTWTPPHFWALALAIKDQYEKVKIPMLPNVLGDRRTRIEIWIYTLLLLPLSLLPLYFKEAGWMFTVLAILFWIWYLKETFVRLKAKTISSYKRLFFISIAYLFLVFVALALDGTLRYFVEGIYD